MPKILSFLGLIFLFQLIQVNNWLYFGVPIDPNNIGKIIKESKEIFSSGIGASKRLWKGWFVLVLSFFLMCIIFYILDHYVRYTFSYAYFLPLSILFLFPILIFFQGTKIHRASPNRSTFHHSLRSFALWLNYSFIPDTNIKKYEDYFISKGDDWGNNKHIILIMGESVASRYCSLYSYKENTTPFLKSLKNNKKFAFSKGISASISTIISFMYFFNIVRETSNLSILKTKKINLFKLAKNAGYKTYCITAQETGLFLDAGIEYIDQLLCVKNDIQLLDQYKEIPKDQKTFIVLNIRNIHSPYEKFHTIEATFKIEHSLQHSYCRALLFHDDWCKKVISLTKEKYEVEYVLMFTSDHGEMLGENGFFGHTILNDVVSDIPVWAVCNDETHPLLNWIRSTPYIPHYELGIKIAKLFGFNITNPNNKDNTYYLHGTNILRPSYIEYKINKNTIKFSPLIGNDFESNFTVLKVKYRNWFKN
ncbi:MAG: sulfatase-like hydrolase/transferase [Proteobacteria bacterium]|nr:sulfatase-like hydrolase/transferase [Pseudomonadota bacterium]